MSRISTTRITGKSVDLRPTAPIHSPEQRDVLVNVIEENGLVASPYYHDGRDVHDKYTQTIRSAQFVFNGVDQYATIPDWSPNGLPFSVEVEAVPLTVDGDLRRIYSGPSQFQMQVQASSNVYRASDPVGTFTTSIVAAQGVVGVHRYAGTGESATLTTNGATGTPNNTPSVEGAITGIAARPNGTQHWHGPIYNLRLTDNSPIQNTDACFGDNSRYVQLQEPIVLEGDFEIEVDWIRQDHPIGNRVAALGRDDADFQKGLLLFYDTAESAPHRIQFYAAGGTNNYDAALADVAIGQHCKVKLVRTAGTTSCFVDGVLKGVPLGLATGKVEFNTIGSWNGGENIATDSAFQNIIIRDLTRGLTWNYGLDEGDNPELGEEQWSDPPSDVNAPWVDNGNGSYSIDGSQTGFTYLNNIGVLTANRVQRFVFTVSGRTAGNLALSGTSHGNISTNGNFVIDAEVTNENISFRADADFDGTLSAISVREVTHVAHNTHPSTQGNYDNLPIYNTDALVGDGTRYIEIPQFSADDDIEVSFDWIRQDRTGTGKQQPLGRDDSYESKIDLHDTGGAGANDIVFRTSSTATITGALADVALGQHCNIRLRRTGSTVEAFVDGVSKGTAGSSGTFSPNVIGRDLDNLPFPADCAYQNITLENLTTGEYVRYKIDEGEGLTVKAYDRDGNEIPAYGENKVVNGDFDFNTNGWSGRLGDDNYIAWDSGTIRVSGEFITAFNGNANQVLNLVEGRQYRVTCDVVECTLGSGGVNQIGIWESNSDASVIDTVSYNRLGGAQSLELVFTAAATNQIRLQTGGNTGFTRFDNVVIEEIQFGTITPDADWQYIEDYSNDGVWTPDVDWQFVPDNSRYYPMSEGSGETLKAYDGNGDPVPTLDGTIQNYTDNWS